MVMSEEMYYQLGEKFVSSHIYSVMPEESNMPVVQENYSETKPDEIPVTVERKEDQLLMTDFINRAKLKEKTPKKVDIIKQKFTQTSLEKFTLPIKKFKIANEWENKLRNEFKQLEKNSEWMEDIDGDHLLRNIVFDEDTKATEVFGPKIKETGEVQDWVAAVDQAMVNLEFDWMQDTQGDIDCTENQERFEKELESQIVDDSSEDYEKRDKINNEADEVTKADKLMVYLTHSIVHDYRL